MTTIGIDQGIGRVLDAEPVIARARVRLDQAGLGPGLWVCTHVVPGDDGSNHVACAVVVEPVERGDDELLALVVDAFTGPSREGEPHVHDEPGAPAGVLGDLAAGDPAHVAGARAAALAQQGVDGGRAVVYPGSDRMTGSLPLADVTALAAVGRVRTMGGDPGADAVLDTRDHVRPLRQAGEWVLHVQPASGGVQVPFEAPANRACCAAHA